MSKLLTVIVAAMFAAVSASAFAASHVGAQGDKKMEKKEKMDKKGEKKKMEKKKSEGKKKMEDKKKMDKMDKK